jgi:hypothetical protein
MTGVWLRRVQPALLMIVLMSAAELRGQNFGFDRAVGGILVDAEGVVRQTTVEDRAALLALMRNQTAVAQPELGQNVGLRSISLRGLEKAIADAQATNGGRLPDAVKYLGGLQRVQYILVYPERGDIVLAGPGEGWRVDDNGMVVGVKSGRPVLRLDDLAVAFRTANTARTQGISVSIDPTPEGRQRFDAVLKNQHSFDRAVIKQLADAFGPQQVTFSGIPTNTHFARILFAAD